MKMLYSCEQIIRYLFQAAQSRVCELATILIVAI